MPRRPVPVRASLALAAVATSLTVALGTVLTPSSAPDPAEQATDVTGDDDAVRAGTASRDQLRPTEDADAAEGPAAGIDAVSPSDEPVTAGELPSYAVQDSGEPLEAAAAPLPTPAASAPPFRLKRSKVVLRKQPPGPVPGDPFTFQIGTLNILGSQHRGNGTGRAAALAGAITGRGADVVGLQEVQDDQLAVMNARLPGYSIWPGQTLGNQGVRLQIAFRDNLFELVDAGSITTTFDFQQRPIPWVLLRERATGGEFHVIDVHNSPGAQARDRYSATTEEIALVQQLRTSGKPVFLMGDTNEHTETACRIAAATGMVGSNGLRSDGGCSTGVGPIKIDHVLGVGGVEFSGHVVDYGAPVAASTDHAFVHASVTVTPLVTPGDGD